MHKTFAIGIVTYQPDEQRLKENIAAAKAQPEAGAILIADNDKGENLGMAGALNQICQQALDLGYEWVVTLDQDSVMQAGTLSEFARYTNQDDIAIICPRIEDRNMGRQYARSDKGTEFIEHCITAGNLVRLSAWQTVGGFTEDLFIDGVDFDFCLKLQEYGYKILRTNNVFLLQEVGYGQAITLPFHKQISILNHSPLRLYYIARNYLYIGSQHHQFLHWAIEVAKRMLIVIYFEQDKWQKLRYMFTGIHHYHKGIMGKKSYKSQHK
jgi:rhamnosyltransferase